MVALDVADAQAFGNQILQPLRAAFNPSAKAVTQTREAGKSSLQAKADVVHAALSSSISFGEFKSIKPQHQQMAKPADPNTEESSNQGYGPCHRGFWAP